MKQKKKNKRDKKKLKRTKTLKKKCCEIFALPLVPAVRRITYNIQMNRHTYLLIECVPLNSSILCSPTIYRGVVRKGCHGYLAPMDILKTCVLANLRKKARNRHKNYLCYTNLDFGTHGLEFLVTPLLYVLLVMICVQIIQKYVFYRKKSKKMPRHREDQKKVPYTLHHVLFKKKQQGWSKIGQKLMILLMLSPR